MGNNVPAVSCFIVLSDIDPSGQDDRETWADGADLHECLARTIETNFAKAAHALDIRRLQNRKHLVTASVDDRLRLCRHGKRGLYHGRIPWGDQSYGRRFQPRAAARYALGLSVIM